MIDHIYPSVVGIRYSKHIGQNRIETWKHVCSEGGGIIYDMKCSFVDEGVWILIETYFH